MIIIGDSTRSRYYLSYFIVARSVTYANNLPDKYPNSTLESKIVVEFNNQLLVYLFMIFAGLLQFTIILFCVLCSGLTKEVLIAFNGQWRNNLAVPVSRLIPYSLISIQLRFYNDYNITIYYLLFITSNWPFFS